MKNVNVNARVTLGDLDGVTVIQTDAGLIASVSNSVTFDKVTGELKVTAPSGTVVDSWQCILSKSATGVALGWLLPLPLQSELPLPDVDVLGIDGSLLGKAYSSPIPNYWDVPVEDLSGNVTHYAASTKLPDATYVSVDTLAGSNLHYLLSV